MICKNINKLFGFHCHALNSDGSISFIESSFQFSDGDLLPIYIKKEGHKYLFFDDGETVHHYIKLGYRGTDAQLNTTAIKKAVHPFGLNFKNNEISLWADEHNAKQGFANFLAGLIAAAHLKRSQLAVKQPINKLVDEVAELLHYWRPNKEITIKPEFIGLSKTKYTPDFLVGNEVILVSEINSNAIGSALRKMVDIAGYDKNIKFRIILEDRLTNQQLYNTQSTILSTMGTVTPFTSLLACKEQAKHRIH